MKRASTSVEGERAPIGLAQALDEMGPNLLTDLADELRIEGFPKPPGGHFPMWQDVGEFREALTDFLVGKNAAFIGGVAVRSYGGRRTATEDYDVLVDRELSVATREFVESRGGMLIGTTESTLEFFIKSIGVHFDVRVAESPLDQGALATAKAATWHGKPLKVVFPSYLAAMKVKAYGERRDEAKKEQDRRDVAGLMAAGATTADEVREVLRQHRPELLPLLDEVLTPPA